MKIYLVGGAVRDQLLGLPVTERDWVVVGATPEQMSKLGYKPVGKDFPVFLHPTTHEEYALARTERKISKGYTGFTFYADPNVTLEEDLQRRDLTINAIAKTADGELIDPFNGKTDLENKTLRHVSEAFAEDPVRILRIARFAARFGDFVIYPTTMSLMHEMVQAGEVDALVPERVWQELQRALGLSFPWRFFEVLKDCHALAKLFPEVDAQAVENLKAAVSLSTKPEIRFAALLGTACRAQALGKVPREYRDLALLVSKYQPKVHDSLNLTAEELLTTLEHVDAFRRPDRFADFLVACEACGASSPQCARFCVAYEIAMQIPIQPILDQGLQGEAINKELHQQRERAIAQLLNDGYSVH